MTDEGELLVGGVRSNEDIIRGAVEHWMRLSDSPHWTRLSPDEGDYVDGLTSTITAALARPESANCCPTCGHRVDQADFDQRREDILLGSLSMMGFYLAAVCLGSLIGTHNAVAAGGSTPAWLAWSIAAVIAAGVTAAMGFLVWATRQIAMPSKRFVRRVERRRARVQAERDAAIADRRRDATDLARSLASELRADTIPPDPTRPGGPR